MTFRPVVRSLVTRPSASGGAVDGDGGSVDCARRAGQWWRGSSRSPCRVGAWGEVDGLAGFAVELVDDEVQDQV